MKYVVLWDIKIQLVPHKRHITSPLQSPSSYVRFEIFKAATTKNAVLWDVKPCGSCKNRGYGGTYRLHYQGENN
jgi:hypothetical protein